MFALLAIASLAACGDEKQAASDDGPSTGRSR
jgi:hypothetical protein